jgi:TolA-binding protein
MKIGNTLSSGSGIGTMIVGEKEKLVDNQDMASKKDKDTVSISEEAKKLSKPLDGTGALAEQTSSPKNNDALVKNLEKQIKQLQKEIENIKKQNLPEEEKQKQIQVKQQQLTQLQSQLTKIREQSSQSSEFNSMGGTSANGFANSLT